MKMIESEKDELSNEEDNTLEKDGEKQALKQKSKNKTKKVLTQEETGCIIRVESKIE